jgi:hypothetical protein
MRTMYCMTLLDEEKARLFCASPMRAMSCNTLFEDVGSRQGGSRPKESNIVVPRDSRNILRTAFYVCHTLSGNSWVHCGELLNQILQINLLIEKMVVQKWYLMIA